MENIVFNFTNLHTYGPAFSDFLKLRKRFFVDQLGWGIPHDDVQEMDQYDNPQAWYSLALQDGCVVGGVRFLPTTAQWGTHTYMLQDAFHGKLIDIPESVLSEEINTPKVWEGTRIVVSDDLVSHAERSECLSSFIGGMAKHIIGENGEEVLALCPTPMVRALRQLGYEVSFVGEPHRNVDDGRRYSVLRAGLGTVDLLAV